MRLFLTPLPLLCRILFSISATFAVTLLIVDLGMTRAADPSPVVIVERLENGLSQFKSQHLVLVTDLPHSPEINALCLLFDNAMPQWGAAFGVNQDKWRDARAQICLIVDRQRFVDLKYIPPEIPRFREGYQFRDQLFMLEQPSAYYRRHLLLHEGTHWFLWRFLGGNGPPWFSEGTCELMSTHAYTNPMGKLEMNWIPSTRESVPYWGRLKLIRESIANHTAPSIGQIMQYSDTAHLTDEPYAWSWAAILFFTRNARFNNDLQETFLPNLRTSVGSEYQLSQNFKNRLKNNWSDVQMEWTAFVNDLDYGFSPEQSMSQIYVDKQKKLSESTIVRIQADRGWQATGVRVEKGETIFTKSSGRVVVRVASEKAEEEKLDNSNWESEPQGITLQYYNGFPLGKIIGTIIPIPQLDRDPTTTNKLDLIPIGKEHTWVAEDSGVLLMKLNEPSKELFDNSGEYQVTIAPKLNLR